MWRITPFVLQDWRHFLVDRQRLSMTSHVKAPKTPGQFHSGHLWCWDTEQLIRPTPLHTHWEQDCVSLRCTSVRTTLRLAFAKRATRSDYTESLCWHILYDHIVMFHNQAIYRTFQLLCCYKIELPVHFVYKMPGTSFGIFLYKNIVYSYNPECTVIEQEQTIWTEFL